MYLIQDYLNQVGFYNIGKPDNKFYSGLFIIIIIYKTIWDFYLTQSTVSPQECWRECFETLCKELKEHLYILYNYA